MLKNRKTSNGQGQMVPREIITQTQEARTLKETENWAWTIFQLINCWNGANSTSGPAFIKLQGWVTLTSYCLSPWLSDQNREPIPQQAVSSSAAPSTQTPQAAPGFPSKIYHISAAQRHSSHVPEILEVTQASTDLTDPGIAAAPALWSHQDALEMLHCGSAGGWAAASTGQLEHWAAHSVILTAQKVCGPEGPTKNIEK